RSSGDRQRSGPTDPSGHGRGPGRVDAADAHRCWRGGKGFLRLANADLGYDPHNTMSLPIPVHDGTYQTWKERSEYFERLRGAIAAMPQVVSAGISTNATPPSNGGDSPLEILGSSALEKPVARANLVSS